MYKYIRNSSVWLCLLLVMLVSSSCGTAQKPAEGNANAQTPGAGVSGSKREQTVELTVSAAASMTDALKEIQKAYETKNAAVKLNFNFGASGALQQQIEQGAPADLFLSAAAKNMKALVDGHLVDASQQTKLLTNELVAIVAADGKASVGKAADLAKAEVKKVAIGIPESVPAGSYAKEALTNEKLWDSLQPKLVQAKDVRQVLQYVETGNAEVGFVYKTEALTSPKVKVAFAVDSTTYPAVEYPIGIVKATKHRKEAEDFYAFLQSKPALDIFVKFGFATIK